MKPTDPSLQSAAASAKAHMLDAAIQASFKRQEEKNRRFWHTAYALLVIILLTTGFIVARLNTSISLQNKIAINNEKHIDCIVKLFTTPLPSTAHARTITNASTTCDIKFVE